MHRHYLLGLVVSSLAIAVACSSTSSTDDGGTDASNDASNGNDGAPTDSAVKDSTTSDASDAGGDGATTFTLTIKNYLAWCNVTVDDGGVTTQASQTIQFAPNTTVNLHGDTANSGAFYWGYWQGATVADGGEITNKDVSVTMSADETVHACCPDNGQQLTQCTF